MTEPKCPECGKHEFVHRFIYSEKRKKEIEELSEKLGLKKLKKIRPRLFKSPFAIAYCTNCGHIIGFAGGGYKARR